MRKIVSLSLALAAGLALLPAGCSDSKPAAAVLPANPVARPKEGPKKTTSGHAQHVGKNTATVQ
jgi:hypothetical protein